MAPKIPLNVWDSLCGACCSARLKPNLPEDNDWRLSAPFLWARWDPPLICHQTHMCKLARLKTIVWTGREMPAALPTDLLWHWSKHITVAFWEKTRSAMNSVPVKSSFTLEQKVPMHWCFLYNLNLAPNCWLYLITVYFFKHALSEDFFHITSNPPGEEYYSHCLVQYVNPNKGWTLIMVHKLSKEGNK